MAVGRFAVLAGFVGAALSFAATDPVEAAPMQHVFGLAAAPAAVVPVRCNCVRHLHRHRYVRRYEPAYAVPVYPAPPVGVTFRKLFDAGYL